MLSSDGVTDSDSEGWELDDTEEESASEVEGVELDDTEEESASEVGYWELDLGGWECVEVSWSVIVVLVVVEGSVSVSVLVVLVVVEGSVSVVTFEVEVTLSMVEDDDVVLAVVVDVEALWFCFFRKGECHCLDFLWGLYLFLGWNHCIVIISFTFIASSKC